MGEAKRRRDGQPAHRPRGNGAAKGNGAASMADHPIMQAYVLVPVGRRTGTDDQGNQVAQLVFQLATPLGQPLVDESGQVVTIPSDIMVTGRQSIIIPK